MQRAGDAFRRAGVAAIYLVHGTFVGPDGLGLLREIARVSPSAAEPLRRWQKQALDRLVTDAGNFTEDFAGRLAQALEQPGHPPLPVRLLNWSSENHHIGRADGAVRLIDELARADLPADGRVLILGHSHGGNVMALASNLLAGHRASNRRFFHAARSYYRWPGTRRIDMPAWERVRTLLAKKQHPLSNRQLDLVTMGTPVRYGWDPGGYARLLHFVNHRPAEGYPAWQVPFPPTVDDILRAAHGDYMQQTAIAGTNLAPPVWAWRAARAEARLKKLLQPGIRKRDLLKRWKLGIRVHQDGETLLVDYGPPDGTVVQHTGGHAVYTRLKWLLFHVEEIAARFYGLATLGSPSQRLEIPPMVEAIQVVTTTTDRADAERIAASLVARKLAACVQVSGPVESTFRWKDSIETSQEWICTAKTIQRLYPQVEQCIRELHSYDEPEIVGVPIVVGSKGYLKWLADSVATPAEGGD